MYHKLNGGVTLFLGKLCVGERADCVITLVFGAFKGGLISESFFLPWLKSPKIDAKPLSPEHYPPKEKMLRGVIWHPFFWKI